MGDDSHSPRGRGSGRFRRRVLQSAFDAAADAVGRGCGHSAATPLAGDASLHWPQSRARRSVTVHFIGAGPGAPDLITVRGLRLIERCPVCLYAGSLVPRAVVAAAPSGARVIDTAPLTLDEIIAHMTEADRAGLDVARLHSGDPSL